MWQKFGNSNISINEVRTPVLWAFDQKTDLFEGCS